MSKAFKNQPVDREAALKGLPKKITALLKTESDRGAILILAAYVEEILGAVVAAGCVTEVLADTILNHRQPAGDFESRLLLAQAFGLIHAEDAKALRIVQKIRNKAAHFDRSGRGFDVLFDSAPTADQVVELAKMLNLDVPEREAIAIRKSFIVSTRYIVTRLISRLMAIRRSPLLQSEQESIDAVFDKYKDILPVKELAALKNAKGGATTYNGIMQLFAATISAYDASDIESPDTVMAIFAEIAVSRVKGLYDSLQKTEEKT